MKNALDPRHQKRQKLIEELFKISFLDQKVSIDAQKVLDNFEFLDEQIKAVAPQFPLEKINKVDLSILRLAVYELMIDKQTPPKVVIDEAIELAKEYGNETSPSFVNGALGKLIEKGTKDGSTS